MKELQFSSMLAASSPSPSSHSAAPAQPEEGDTHSTNAPSVTGQDSQIRAEVSKLLSENKGLADRLAEAERGLTEAGLALQQKEGHLQGLHVSIDCLYTLLLCQGRQ